MSVNKQLKRRSFETTPSHSYLPEYRRSILRSTAIPGKDPRTKFR